MNRFYFITTCVLLAACCFGCQSDHTKSETTDAVDSTNIKNDSTASITPKEDEETPPAAADMVFNDFIDAFVNNKTFQLSRITFPLPHYIDGKETRIAKENWVYDPIHRDDDVYTMIFDGSNISKDAEEDTIPLHSFKVERINLDKGRIKQYQFNKEKGAWKLTAINEHFFKDNVNNDFYNFYQKFSSDTIFQREHLLSSFVYKTYDYEASEYIEGTLEPEQWSEVCPDLPVGIITNFICGEINPKSIKRTFTICRSASELNTTIEFRHWGGKWVVMSLEE